MKKKYTKTNWVDGKTCVGANLLNKIESGIEGLYQNAVEMSQLVGGEDISIQKNEEDNLVVSIKEDNSLLRSTGISEVEFGEELPNEPKSTGLYFTRDSRTGKFSVYYGNSLVFSSVPDTTSPSILGGYIKIDEPDETGRVRIDYLDENNDIEVEMEARVNGESVDILEDEDGNFYIQLEDSIESEVEVIISADGYEDLRKTETFTWIAPEEESSVFEGTVELSLIDGFTDQFEVVYTGTDASEVTFGFSDNPEDPFYEVLSGNTIKKLRPGVFTLVISIFAEGFEQKDVTLNLDWRDLAETPEISFEEERNEKNEVVSVEVRISNYTSYTITLDGDEVVDGLFTFDANYEEDQSIIVRATNNPDETTHISKEVEEYYSLRKLAKIASQPGDISTTMTATSINVEVSGKDADTKITLLDSEENTLENPFSIPRPGVEEEDSIFQLTVTTLDLGEEYEKTTFHEEIEIPHQVYSTPATPNVTEGEEAYTIDFIGDITRVYLDEQQVDIPYVVIRQEENDQELIFKVYTEEDTKLETETEITINVPRVLITSTPTINTEEVDEAVIVTATGEGTITLSIVGGEIVDNPYTIEKTDQPQTINLMATAKADGKRISSTTLEIIVPALIPEKSDLEGNIVVSDVNEDGEVQISYTGNENVTIEVSLNEGELRTISSGDSVQLVSQDEPNEIYVLVSANGYNDKELEVQRMWQEKTETPEIIWDSDTDTLDINGQGTLFINVVGDPLVTIDPSNLPYTFDPVSIATTYIISVTAQEEGKLVSDTAEETITILPELSGDIEIDGPNEEGSISISYSGNEDVIILATIDEEDPIQLQNPDSMSLESREESHLVEITVQAEGYKVKTRREEIRWWVEPETPDPEPEP